MGDKASNDVEVEFNESQLAVDPDSGEKRPIMLLLRRLIRNKQNTVMTNAQIVDILEREFGIDVKSSHELEVDIYIKIIKKYLKDWPQWEELERISTKLSNIKDFEAVSKVLNHKYKNLKEYLGVMLNAAKPLAKEAVKSVTTEKSKKETNIDSSDVVMEIQCTREQLYQLFYRRPRMDLNNSVFNMSILEPSRIVLKALNFEEILKAGWVKIDIKLPHFTYVQEVMYILRHVLVNKVRNESTTKDISLNTNLQMKAFKKTKNYRRNQIIAQFNGILDECITTNYEMYSILNTVFDILKQQLHDSNIYKVPGNYRKFASKYKYVRYFYAENLNSNDARYELQLEEVVSPGYQFYIGKIGKMQKPLRPFAEWFKVECLICKVKFTGTLNIKEILQAHFNDHHQKEPEWQCMHCKKKFGFDFLAKNYWSHEC